MSYGFKSPPRLTPTTLLDDVMSFLQRGDREHFDGLARATWDPDATLADLTGTLRSATKPQPMRAAA